MLQTELIEQNEKTEVVQVETLDHLGIVAGLVDKLKLVERIDARVPIAMAHGAIVSHGQCIKGIAIVDSIREVQGKVSQETRLYITSHIGKNVDLIANAIRSYWFVENKLHWQLDVSFNEDQNRLRSGYAAENFSMMNKIALNLLKNEKSTKVGVKTKRLKAGWDDVYMMKVLTVGFSSV